MNQGVSFADKMRQEYGEEVDQRRALEEARVVAAQEAVRKQLGKLKVWLKKIGSRRESDGKLHVSYGALFEAVQGDMSTLSGTLKTARRLGIVAFEGETLFQGASDKVDIALLDETDKADYVIAVREKGKHGKDEERDPFALDKGTNAVVNCFRCKEPVQKTERVGVADCVLHRKCFECHLDTCTIQLTPARYASIVVDNELRFYCVAHFKELFKRNANYTTGFRSDKTIESDPHLKK